MESKQQFVNEIYIMKLILEEIIIIDNTKLKWSLNNVI